MTIAIYLLGRRLSFKQKRDRVRELEADAWKVLGPIRTHGLNSKIIVMNVARFKRGYDGSNRVNWRGHVFTGPELIEIVHSGVEVIARVTESYYDSGRRRTLDKTSRRAPNVIEVGHIPWTWIEDIAPKGDQFDGSAIFFVNHRAPGRQPYDYVTFREGTPVPFGPNGRDYYQPIPELGTWRPRPIRDRWRFMKSMRLEREMYRQARSASEDAD